MRLAGTCMLHLGPRVGCRMLRLPAHRRQDGWLQMGVHWCNPLLRCLHTGRDPPPASPLVLLLSGIGGLSNAALPAPPLLQCGCEPQSAAPFSGRRQLNQQPACNPHGTGPGTRLDLNVDLHAWRAAIKPIKPLFICHQFSLPTRVTITRTVDRLGCVSLC